MLQSQDPFPFPEGDGHAPKGRMKVRIPQNNHQLSEDAANARCLSVFQLGSRLLNLFQNRFCTWTMAQPTSLVIQLSGNHQVFVGREGVPYSEVAPNPRLKDSVYAGFCASSAVIESYVSEDLCNSES